MLIVTKQPPRYLVGRLALGKLFQIFGQLLIVTNCFRVFGHIFVVLDLDYWSVCRLQRPKIWFQALLQLACKVVCFDQIEVKYINISL